MGYARDFVDVVRSLIPFWQKGSKVRVISNAGGLNPHGFAKACAEVLRQAGLHSMKIGVVPAMMSCHLCKQRGAKVHQVKLVREPRDRQPLTKVWVRWSRQCLSRRATIVRR